MHQRQSSCLSFKSAGISHFGGCMEQPLGFVNLEHMIEKKWGMMSICDLDQLLKQLEEDEHITAAEHESLLTRMAGQ